VRVLLDEQVPRGLADALIGHEVCTLTQMGWKGLSNGQLLATAATKFDVLITMDKRMPVDREVSQYQIGVVLVRAGSNRLDALLPLVPRILEAMAVVHPGELKRVGA
jgi:predicted nuclease of predicted toxin-antitoxin system